jgi:hypothetical protein
MPAAQSIHATTSIWRIGWMPVFGRVGAAGLVVGVALGLVALGVGLGLLVLGLLGLGLLGLLVLGLLGPGLFGPAGDDGEPLVTGPTTGPVGDADGPPADVLGVGEPFDETGTLLPLVGDAPTTAA